MFLKNILHFGFEVDAGFWTPARLVRQGPGEGPAAQPAPSAETEKQVDAPAGAPAAAAGAARVEVGVARAAAARQAGAREAAGAAVAADALVTPTSAPAAPAAGLRVPEAAPTPPATGTQGPAEAAPTAPPVTQQEKDELTKKPGFELPANEEEIQKRLRGQIQGKPLMQREAEICRAILQDRQRAQETAPGGIFGNKKEWADMFKMGMEEVKKAIAALIALLNSLGLGGKHGENLSSPVEGKTKFPLKEAYRTGQGVKIEAGQGAKIKSMTAGKVVDNPPGAPPDSITVQSSDNSKITYIGIATTFEKDAEVTAGMELGTTKTADLDIRHFDAQGAEQDPTATILKDFISAPEAQAQTPELPALEVKNPPMDLAAGQKLQPTARPWNIGHGKVFTCKPGTAVKTISKGKITAVERADAVANVTIEFKDNKKIKIMGLKNDGTLTARENQTPDAGATIGKTHGNAFNIAYFENETAKDPKELLSAYWPTEAATAATSAQPTVPPAKSAPAKPAAGSAPVQPGPKKP